MSDLDHGPSVSVIVPCRNEAASILDTLRSVLGQKSPDGTPFEQWAELIVVNDASEDATGSKLEQFRDRNPFVRVLYSPERRGLAGSYNLAIAEARAALVLTCHADCRLIGADYLSRVVAHFDDPSVAAVTGKPAIPDAARLSFVEKAYLVTHLMDVEDEPALVREINFAEGRCDGFRKAALHAVGLFNEKTRISGEDQVLAIELRRSGYKVLQDTSLRYALSCGSSQNTLWRIVARQAVLAQGQAFIVLRRGLGTTRLADSTPNRRRRKRLRMAQVVYPALLLPLLAALGYFSLPAALFAALGALGARLAFHVLLAGPRLTWWETLKMFPIAVACDAWYCLGFVRGAWRSCTNKAV